jgi:hypothetical protein
VFREGLPHPTVVEMEDDMEIDMADFLFLVPLTLLVVGACKIDKSDCTHGR